MHNFASIGQKLTSHTTQRANNALVLCSSVVLVSYVSTVLVSVDINLIVAKHREETCFSLLELKMYCPSWSMGKLW